MNRDQMEAHLALHGWEPMGYAAMWAGVYKEGSGLVYRKTESAAKEGLGMYSRFKPLSKYESLWVNLSDTCLSQVLEYIKEKQL